MTASLRARRAVLMALAIGMLLLAGAGQAGAHEDDDENAKAADLVRQAIALIVNTPADAEGIADKIADAGTAEDSAGVDLALVAQAGEAFEDGDLHRARALLERSIGAQPHLNEAEPPPIRESTPTSATPEPMGEMPESAGARDVGNTPMTMATGDEPGGELIADPLEVRPRLDGGDWALLAASLGAGLVGIWLGLLWRPGPGLSG